MKDFAPKCKQYIQLFKPENKIHVKFAGKIFIIFNQLAHTKAHEVSEFRISLECMNGRS